MSMLPPEENFFRNLPERHQGREERQDNANPPEDQACSVPPSPRLSEDQCSHLDDSVETDSSRREICRLLNVILEVLQRRRGKADPSGGKEGHEAEEEDEVEDPDDDAEDTKALELIWQCLEVDSQDLKVEYLNIHSLVADSLGALTPVPLLIAQSQLSHSCSEQSYIHA